MRKNVSILCASNCRVTTRVNVLCTGDSRRKIVGIIERPVFAESGVDLIVVEITENVHNGNRPAARIICARIAATINYSSCIWWRAMHLAPCVPALFRDRLYRVHLHPRLLFLRIVEGNGRHKRSKKSIDGKHHRYCCASIIFHNNVFSTRQRYAQFRSAGFRLSSAIPPRSRCCS